MNQMLIKELDFHITNKCNMNCLHCLYDSGKKVIEEMEYKYIEKIIDEFSEITEGKGSINLFGGEIFTRKDIFDVVYYIKQKGLNLGIITNGKFGNDIFNKIVECKPDRLTIDLDGASSNTHDWLRNDIGSFEKSLEMIKRFIDNKIPISVTTVLNKKNINELVDMLNLCKKNKISSILFFYMTPLGRGIKLNNYVLSGEEWIKAKKIVKKWIKENSPQFSIIWENAFKEQNESKLERILCNKFSGEVLNIKCNGDVYFCGLLTSVDNFKIGNIKTKTLKEIINNAKKISTNMNGCFALKHTKDYTLNNSKENKIIPGCPYDIEQLNNYNEST